MSGKRTQSRTRHGYEKKIKKIMKKRRTLPEPHAAAIAFFDMPNSTNAMKRNPRKAIPLMLCHNAICRTIIESNAGCVVKELGDGLMVSFDNSAKAVACAGLVIQNLRLYASYVHTKVSVAYGTLWGIENDRGDRDVYGTPVHMSQRLSEIATVDAVVIDAKDKGHIMEWLEDSGHTVRPVRSKLRNYPHTKVYKISF